MPIGCSVSVRVLSVWVRFISKEQISDQPYYWNHEDDGPDNARCQRASRHTSPKRYDGDNCDDLSNQQNNGNKSFHLACC